MGCGSSQEDKKNQKKSEETGKVVEKTDQRIQDDPPSELAEQIKKDQAAYIEAATKVGPPPMPPTGQLEIKTKTQTFNHLYDFAIGQEGFLWFKLRPGFPKEQINDWEQNGEDPARYSKEWRPLAFPGFFGRTNDKETSPCTEISADEEYLVGVDAKKEIFYRQVLHGPRKSYIEPAPYSCHSVLTTNDWAERWFSIPVLYHIEDFLRGGDLEYPEGCMASAISQRGPWTNFSEDAHNRKIPDRQDNDPTYQIITLYALEKFGRRIRLYDPWAPKYAPTFVHLPETLRRSFYATNISCAGGTIFAIGYECDRLTKTKKLKAYTRLVDMDSAGWNPLLKYSFIMPEAGDNSKGDLVPTETNLMKLLRMLPWQPEWQEQPLPMDGELTDLVTIRQTPHSWDENGPVPEVMPAVPEMRLPETPVDDMYKAGGGRRARELRINGKSADGKLGYFRKMIAADSWTFVESEAYVTAEHLPRTAAVTKPLAPCSIQDYIGTATFSKPADGWLGDLFGVEREQVRYKVKINGYGAGSNAVQIYFFPLPEDCGEKDDDVKPKDEETIDAFKDADDEDEREVAQAHTIPGLKEGEQSHRVITMYVRDNLMTFLPPWFNCLVDAVLPDDIADKFFHSEDLFCDDLELDDDLVKVFKATNGKPFSYRCDVIGEHKSGELKIETKDDDGAPILKIDNLKPVGRNPLRWLDTKPNAVPPAEGNGSE